MKKIITVLGLLCSLPVLAQSVTEPTISAKEQEEFVNLLKSRGITDAKQRRSNCSGHTRGREKLIGQAAWKQQLGTRSSGETAACREPNGKIYGGCAGEKLSVKASGDGKRRSSSQYQAGKVPLQPERK